MGLVGRLVGQSHREEGDDRGHQVDRRVHRLGDDRDRTGGQTGRHLQRDEQAVGEDRHGGRPLLARRLGGRAHRVRRGGGRSAKRSRRRRGAFIGALLRGAGATSSTEPGCLPLLLIGRDQAPHQRARRPPAMADLVLLLRAQLGHRAALRAVVGEEGRVVAESPVAARLEGERPLTATVDQLLPPTRLHVRERADVSHPPVAVRRHLGEQLGQVLLVTGALAGEAGRPHARCAAQGRGLDAGIVGDGGPAGGRRGRAGLDQGVVRERRARLGRKLNVVGQRLQAVGVHERTELAQLVGVAGGEHERGHRLGVG